MITNSAPKNIEQAYPEFRFFLNEVTTIGETSYIYSTGSGKILTDAWETHILVISRAVLDSDPIIIDSHISPDLGMFNFLTSDTSIFIGGNPDFLEKHPQLFQAVLLKHSDFYKRIEERYKRLITPKNTNKVEMFTARVETDLKKSFAAKCEEEGEGQSQVIRRLMMHYVRNGNKSSFF